jgi:Methionine aminopeptidase
MHRWQRIWSAVFATAALAAAAGGCSDSSAPDPSQPSQPGDTRLSADLGIVRRSTAINGFVDTVVTFYAGPRPGTRGQDLLPRARRESRRGVRALKIGSATLLSRPDASPIADGDSVLITMRVVDPALLLVEFQPSGLLFNPAEPAELEMQYGEGDDDLNHDGRQDSEDEALISSLGIWRQELPGLPFVRLSSSLFTSLAACDTKITGFTRYALAY